MLVIRGDVFRKTPAASCKNAAGVGSSDALFFDESLKYVPTGEKRLSAHTHTLTHTRDHFPPMTAEDAASRRRRLHLPLDGAVGKLNITAAQENRNDKTTHD